MSYDTDIALGERYRDEQTGIEGVATAVTFYQYACERVTIETVIREKVEEYVFDAPRLVSATTGVKATASRPGGTRGVPDRPTTRRGRTT